MAGLGIYSSYKRIKDEQELLNPEMKPPMVDNSLSDKDFNRLRDLKQVVNKKLKK